MTETVVTYASERRARRYREALAALYNARYEPTDDTYCFSDPTGVAKRLVVERLAQKSYRVAIEVIAHA